MSNINPNARPDILIQTWLRSDFTRAIAALKKFGKGRNRGKAAVFVDNGNFIIEFGDAKQGVPVSDNWSGFLQMDIQLLLQAKTNQSKDVNALLKHEGETLSIDDVPVARCVWTPERPKY